MPSPAGTARDAASASVVGHLVAELTGVAESCLRDSALLGGLLIAAAGAAGLHAYTSPLLRITDARGVDGLLMLDGGHLSIHAHAPSGTLRLDALAPEPADLARALDVFRRRLSPLAVVARRIDRSGAE